MANANEAVGSEDRSSKGNFYFRNHKRGVSIFDITPQPSGMSEGVSACTNTSQGTNIFMPNNEDHSMASSPMSSPSLPPSSVPTMSNRRPINRKDLGMRPIGSPSGTVSYGQSSSLSSLGLSSYSNNADLRTLNNRRGSSSSRRGSRAGLEMLDSHSTLFANAGPSSRRNSVILDQSSSSDSDLGMDELDDSYCNQRDSLSGIAVKPFVLSRKPTLSRTSSGSYAKAAPASASVIMQPAPIRLISSSGKNLKPKAKSFLRVSKELEAESAPLDFEMRREAEITASIRSDFSLNGNSKPNSYLQHGVFPFDEESTMPIASNLESSVDDKTLRSTSPTATDAEKHFLPINTQKPPLFRQQTPPLSMFRPGLHSDTEDSDIVVGSPSAALPVLKRKIIMEESDTNVFKRRAVSPGGMSPVIGSPSIKRATLKQMQDASDDLSTMSLS